MTKKLKVLDLFSGSGAWSLALEALGTYETVAFCEIDPFCLDILNRHWPTLPKFKDIRNMSVTHIYAGEGWLHEYSDKPTPDAEVFAYDIDVITASWPCQGFSVAGAKKGMQDERSGLWTEVKRVIKEVRPGWVVLENSANLRNLGLAEVLQDLWSIGYNNIRWDILPANAYGAIHQRERIFIIANRNGHGLHSQAHAPTEEASRRRSSAWADFCNRQCPKPSFYGMDDGPTTWLDRAGDGGYRDIERSRKQRVKMCGNGVYLPIITELGKYILQHEGLL